jgi:N-methylhydantoinase A
MGSVRVGIDIGGAFTDLVAYDESTGELRWAKVESTPGELSNGVMDCVRRSGVPREEFKQVIHGQTVVINTIIERKGAKVGLITTRGHRDILELQRGNRRDMYNFRYRKPEAIVPRFRRIEVDERTMADGSMLTELNPSQVAEKSKKLVDEGAEVVCVSFLNSYVNPENERLAAETIKRLVGVPVVLSHETTREWREYERFVTAALNAYVLPKLNVYLATLQGRLAKDPNANMAMTSEGGMVTFDFARRFPIYTIESGPVAGVVGAIGVANIIGEKNIITLDGGSTTTKASLVESYAPEITTEYNVERDRFRPGLPVMVPVIRTVEIGNGGTSIAWIDEVGRVRVGPRAAGADPGPACYGKGGKEPTLTDAYVLTGLLNPKHLLGGELEIHKDKAADAIERISHELGNSVEEAAQGIIELANDNAAYAINLVSVQRGYDPRDFTLIAYGGSGPMFAPFIAKELEIEKIVVPTIPPGVFSAWGMLNTDIRHSSVYTHILKLDASNLEAVNETYERLEEEMMGVFRSESISEPIEVERYSDIRYYGQEHTVRVRVKGGRLKVDDLGLIADSFDLAHEREYAFKLPGDLMEIVNFHVVGVKKVGKLALMELLDSGGAAEDAMVDSRTVYLKGEKASIPVIDRMRLGKGAHILGPAIIEDPTATIIALEGQSAAVDRYGNIAIKRVKE